MPLSTELHNLQVGPNNPDGKTLGMSASDPVGFHGATPVVQVAGANQQAIPTAGGTLNQSGGAGALTHYTSTQSPSAVVANTVAEQSVTVTGVLATDLVIMNKPTAQAGLGFAHGRVLSANTVKLVFANLTAGTLTPTTSQAYIITTIPANLQLAATLTPAAIPANQVSEQSFTVAGLSTGMIVAVNKATTDAGIAVLSSRVSANNTLAITYMNATAGVLTPTAAEAYEIAAFNGMVAASQMLLFGAAATLAGVATITSTEQAVTVAGIQAADVMVGATKPTQQAGLAFVNGRVSAASTIQLSFVNPTVAMLTPTGGEVYGVTVFRPSPAAPMSLYTNPTLTPGSVSANTSGEQTFTVTGLVSGQPVHANPNYNLALGNNAIAIAGLRVSATNTLAVTFVNSSSAAITPAAGTWTVAQFNLVTPTAGNYVSQLVSPLSTIGASLTNAMRSAMVTKGLIAGA